jgi:hypothetical protein
MRRSAEEELLAFLSFTPRIRLTGVGQKDELSTKQTRLPCMRGLPPSVHFNKHSHSNTPTPRYCEEEGDARREVDMQMLYVGSGRIVMSGWD